MLNQFSHFTNLLSLMAKRFKLNLARVITSLQLCRKTSAETPLPAIYRLSPVNSKVFDVRFPNSLSAPPLSTPEYPLPKGQVSSKKVISVECGCGPGSCTQDLFTRGNFPRYKWKKEAARCHVVSKEPNPCRKIHDASRAGDASPVWVNENKKQSQANKKQQKTLTRVFSRDIGCFSSEEDASKETEALISISRSFSNDSSFELDHSLESTTDRFYNGENGRKNKKVITTNIKKFRRMKRYNSKNYKGSIMAVSSPEMESPPKTSVLKRVLPCTVDGKLRESIAVVKKSLDPYQDFKRSMLEMILKKQIFEGKDLEELLQCFLSLNSRKHHGIIVEAFSEIWQVLFL